MALPCQRRISGDDPEVSDLRRRRHAILMLSCRAILCLDSFASNRRFCRVAHGAIIAIVADDASALAHASVSRVCRAGRKAHDGMYEPSLLLAARPVARCAPQCTQQMRPMRERFSGAPTPHARRAVPENLRQHIQNFPAGAVYVRYSHHSSTTARACEHAVGRAWVVQASSPCVHCVHGIAGVERRLPPVQKSAAAGDSAGR